MSSKFIYAQQFFEESTRIHNNFYDYSKVIYINAREKVEIICPIHGSFWQDPTNHKKGCGCPRCKAHNNKVRQSSNTFEFISKAKLIHGESYDYSLVNYVTNSTKVIIVCQTHGGFIQAPNKHLYGRGCPLCGKSKSIKSMAITKTGKVSPKRLTTQQFIEDAIKIHNDTYDYSLVEYSTCKDAVKIICKTHGVFLQKPSKHKIGHGCPHCTQFKSYSFKANKWLDSISQNLIREYRIPENKLRTVDGYDPASNTIYQFHGDYYHGNPAIYNPSDINKKLNKSYGELYNETIIKDQELRDHGYNLVIMWENDWK